MSRQPGWMVTQTGRPAMRSPGRPPVRREVERAFWVKIAEGMGSEDAAIVRGHVKVPSGGQRKSPLVARESPILASVVSAPS